MNPIHGNCPQFLRTLAELLGFSASIRERQLQEPGRRPTTLLQMR